MARIPRRFQIDETDVAPENMDVITKLAALFNPFIDDVVTALDGAIDLNNLNIKLINITVRVGDDGVPIQGQEFRSPLINKRVSGLVCVNAVNTNTVNLYPTGTPFLSFQTSGQMVQINHISNIPSGQTFVLTLLVL